jgi:2-desacetyl-2-hydroxyethyl bacteriochlorophyllide A dehydrogenase
MNSRKIFIPEKGRVEFLKCNVAEPRPGEVQVDVYASLISPGTERAFILNLENTTGVYPINGMGYCTAGIVTAVGEGVKDFKPGDRVAAQLGHCSLGNIDRNSVNHIPDNISFEEGAFTPLAVIAIQAVRKARIELGENVMVFGAGIVGQLAMQTALISGANRVIIADRVKKRLNLALANRADGALDTGDPEWISKLSDLTGGRMPEVVIESTGFPDPIRTSCEICRNFGRVIILGSTRGDTSINFYKDVHKKALHIIGAHISSNPEVDSYPGYWNYKDNARTFLQAVSSGKMDVKSLITETVEADKALEAYDRMLGWNTDMVATIIKWK